MKHTSDTWYNVLFKREVTILNKEGWNNDDYSWNEELITQQEFERRLCKSSIVWDTSKL